MSAEFRLPAVVPPQAIVEVCLCHHVRRAARAVTRAFDEALAPLDLTAAQFNMLAVIGISESRSASIVSRTLAMDRTTLSRNLKPLRDAGFLISGGGAGRRPGTLALTDSGRALLSEASARWQQAQSQLTQRMGAGQAGVLLQALDAATRSAVIL